MSSKLRNHQNNSTPVCRLGLTLIELLVVIAIIGVLVSLLLPAVQAAREAARQSHCQNNLRQVALGVLNHTNTHDEQLPALWKSESPMPWNNFSWRVDVLPYLESSSLHDSLRLDHPPLADINRKAIATQLSVFQCPSTPDSPRLVQSLGPAGGGYDNLFIGACDYTAIHDVANNEADEPLAAAWRSKDILDADDLVPGMAVVTDRVSPQLRIQQGSLNMIEDGLAKTALLVEQAGKPLKYDRSRIQLETMPSEGAWATAEFSSFYASGINRDNYSGIYGFHEGAFIAMCDGSVHFVSSAMEVEVITALLSRNGDEIIDADDWQ